MTIQELVTEYLAARSAGGLVLGEPEVLDAAINAVRYYAAYGDIKSLSLSDVLPGVGSDGAIYPDPLPTVTPDVVPSLPIKGVGAITDATVLSVGEWAVIRPLFVLYVDRENAMRLEASRGLGLDPYGRSVSEIAADIAAMENDIIPAKAFSHAVIEVV